MNERRALIVGINAYDVFEPLDCCVDDALEMETLLSRHSDGEPNYACRLLIAGEEGRVTSQILGQAIDTVFDGVAGADVLFYFSGHGMASDDGGYLVTQESGPGLPGLPMKDLLERANRSGASTLIILDCCHSGQIGNITSGDGLNRAELAEGVTVLAASTAQQESQQGMINSVFTELLLDAMNGAAADVRGRVSAASMYAYVEQVLGPWQQRPVYKSHAKRLKAVRRCTPAVTDSLLLKLPKLFPTEHHRYRMDKSYEWSEKKHAKKKHVRIFNDFKKLRNAGLLATEDQEDLYFVALKKLHVSLTPRGRYYWRLVKKGRLG